MITCLKAATLSQDFIQKAKVRINDLPRIPRWCISHEEMVGRMDQFHPHSFDEKSSKEICQAALDQTDAGETMESTSKKDTVHGQRRMSTRMSKTVFVGLNGGRDNTYIKRAVVENLFCLRSGQDAKDCRIYFKHSC